MLGLCSPQDNEKFTCPLTGFSGPCSWLVVHEPCWPTFDFCTPCSACSAWLLAIIREPGGGVQPHSTPANGKLDSKRSAKSLRGNQGWEQKQDQGEAGTASASTDGGDSQETVKKKTIRSAVWTTEKICRISREDLWQLQENNGWQKPPCARPTSAKRRRTTRSGP